MARKVSFSALESRSARLRLKIRRRPYSGPSLARGISLMYRRNKTNGTWVLKVSDGGGSYWTKGFALADDFEDADAKNVLTFYQAQDAAKRLARGEDGSPDNAPITVDGALTAYKTDLEARSANPYNAEHPRVHLSKVLLAKPVALLAATELKKWRDGLLGTMAPATINRLCRCVCAALTLAAQHDKRIKNRGEWELGLAILPDAQEARNVIISDDKVREFVATAYGLDHQFGLLTDTLAITGARPSQAVRLRVEDLHDHPSKPKLMMPKSAKGGGRMLRIIMLLLLTSSPAYAGWFGYDNYEDCMLGRMKGQAQSMYPNADKLCKKEFKVEFVIYTDSVKWSFSGNDVLTLWSYNLMMNI
jgi:hypothetical protein